MADALDSKSSVLRDVWVQLPPPALGREKNDWRGCLSGRLRCLLGRRRFGRQPLCSRKRRALLLRRGVDPGPSRRRERRVKCPGKRGHATFSAIAKNVFPEKNRPSWLHKRTGQFSDPVNPRKPRAKTGKKVACPLSYGNRRRMISRTSASHALRCSGVLRMIDSKLRR